MHQIQHCPSQNHLLAFLPTSEFQRLEANLELVHLSLGEVLYESGDAHDSVYFPTTAVVSMFYVLKDGASAEIAIVGNEGVLGISLVMGGGTTSNRAVVRSAGWCYRFQTCHLKKELQRGGPLMALLLLYIQALMTQMTQTALCNRHHNIYQQLCRWLLLSLDRVDSNSLTITQDLIADMLWVRREGVSEAAGRLRSGGYIRYARGHITVLDRPGLEKSACECYFVIRNEFERLFSTILPGDPKQELGHYD